MPEGLEIEMYRRSAEIIVGRTVASVQLADPAYVRHGLGHDALQDQLVGSSIAAVRRHGKLLLVDSDRATLGLRFGMTGRLIVDGHAAIGQLEYSSSRNDPAWDRFGLTFVEGGALVMRDQRRLGSVELDPDEETLGVDLFAIDARSLRPVLGGSSRPLKARLMDQRQLAGLGNLLTDEILWRASLDPRRPADSLTGADKRRLLYHLKSVTAQLLTRGGSHTGDLQDQRHSGGRCPRDGAELQIHTIGGRTTYACPEHQRLSSEGGS